MVTNRIFWSLFRGHNQAIFGDIEMYNYTFIHVFFVYLFNLISAK